MSRDSLNSSSQSGILDGITVFLSDLVVNFTFFQSVSVRSVKYPIRTRQDDEYARVVLRFCISKKYSKIE